MLWRCAITSIKSNQCEITEHNDTVIHNDTQCTSVLGPCTNSKSRGKPRTCKVLVAVCRTLPSVVASSMSRGRSLKDLTNMDQWVEDFCYRSEEDVFQYSDFWDLKGGHPQIFAGRKQASARFWFAHFCQMLECQTGWHYVFAHFTLARWVDLSPRPTDFRPLKLDYFVFWKHVYAGWISRVATNR